MFLRSKYVLPILFLVFAPLAASSQVFVGFQAGSTGKIYEYTPGGANVPGGGAGGSWSLTDTGTSPFGLAFSPDGNLFVSNVAGNTVQEYDGATGALVGTVASGHSSPYNLIFDASSNLYVSEFGGNRVDKFALIAGSYVLQATIGVIAPTGLALRGSDVLVESFYAATVLDIDPTFTSTSLYATLTDNPLGLAGGPDGRYYAVTPHNIQVLDPISQTSSVWGATQLPGFAYNAQIAFGGGLAYATSEQGVRKYDAFTGATAGVINGMYDDRHNDSVAVRPSAAEGTPEPGAVALGVGALASGAFFIRRRRKIS